MILPPLPPLLITLGISLLVVALGIVWLDARRASNAETTLKESSWEPAHKYTQLSPDFYAHLEQTNMALHAAEKAARDAVLSER